MDDLEERHNAFMKYDGKDAMSLIIHASELQRDMLLRIKHLTELLQIPCCLCAANIEIKGSWTQGNNALPVFDGRCCDSCNMQIVIPERLRRVQGC